MDIFKVIQNAIIDLIKELQKTGCLMQGLDLRSVTTQLPRNPKHADVVSNVSMVLSEQAVMNAMDLANLIAMQLKPKVSWIKQIDVVKPGFINIWLTDEFWFFLMGYYINGEKPYVKPYKNADKVLVEYVSANPTGPLHIGHARSAIYGDVLCNILAALGYKVKREFYINNIGEQMRRLRESVKAVSLGREIPEDGYTGEYIKDIVRAGVDPETYITTMINKDLSDLGVYFDSYVKEMDIMIQTTNLSTALDTLKKKGLTYIDSYSNSLMFRSKRFGDDVDRVIQRGNGSNTYFATDIAYHLNKIHRGYTHMINILGADHSGYISRITNTTKALTDDPTNMEFITLQLVRLMKNGVPYKMSKRKANYVTLREALDEIGADILRFMMIMKSHNKSMDFDMDIAIEKSNDNPYWYVQYAHARCCSVIDKANGNGMGYLRMNNFAPPTIAPQERDLLQKLSQWKYIIDDINDSYDVHKLANYIYDVSSVFHKLYNSKIVFVDSNDLIHTAYRLNLVMATQNIIGVGLQLMGIQPLNKV